MEESNKITRVQLSLYAQKLRNVAGLGKGKSDPYAVVTLIASGSNEQPRVLGKTEVIKNDLSPRWTKTFLIDYEFGKSTRVNVGIYDEIRKAKHNKPIGSAVFEIGELLGARGNIKAKKLKSGGIVFARVEKAADVDNGSIEFTLQGLKLKNVEGLLSKSDPFFEVSRRINVAGGPTWQTVYRSKHIMNNLNPTWSSVTLSLNDLCGGDQDKPILISVFDWQKSGKHRAMGSFETSVNGILAARTHSGTDNVNSLDKTNAFRLRRKNTHYGMVVVTAASISAGGGIASAAVPDPRMNVTPTIPVSESQRQPSSAVEGLVPAVIPVPSIPPYAYTTPITASPPSRPKFVEYVSGGCGLQMCVAVDFTGSNGDPRRPGTLHYQHPDGSLNDYEKALTAVGSIVARYDADQKFPVWGFGAKYGGVIQQCFQMGHSSEMTGIAGILEAYRATFKTGLTMSGPTIFSEVVNLAAAQARSKQEESKRIGQQAYSILLILTDGAVSDINGTKHAIHAASDAPLSIVIIGIGEADFSAMQFLDDFQSQEGGGRDICQFVQFSRYKDNKTALTQATLDEIPDQLVDYFYGHGILPLPAITGSKVDVVAEQFNEDVDIDLSIDVNEEGEICLADSVNSGGFYDETSYGNFSTYAGIAVLPPPTAPYQPPAVPPHGVAAQPQQGTPYTPGGKQNIPAVAARVFDVQVPVGVSEGMQLQVQNPITRQALIVTVPNGVTAGGTFPVAY